MAITFAHRYKAVMPFVRLHDREDERYGGLQVGLTTFSRD